VVQFVAENLVFWATSETIGYALCPTLLVVSGVRCQ